eukprot:scaffold1050_cov51-Attheya_sp.AAC.1
MLRLREERTNPLFVLSLWPASQKTYANHSIGQSSLLYQVFAHNLLVNGGSLFRDAKLTILGFPSKKVTCSFFKLLKRSNYLLYDHQDP